MTDQEPRKAAVIEISLDEVPDELYAELPQDVLVPIMRPRKERMVTGLDVRGASNALLPCLTRDEALICEVQIARDLFIEAFGLPVNVVDWPEGVGGVFLRTVDSFMRDPELPWFDLTVRNLYRDSLVESARKMWASVELVPPDRDARVAELALCELIRLTSTRSVVIAVAPRARRIILSYSYQLPNLNVETEGPVALLARWKSSVRQFLGIEPLIMATSVEKAKSCQSYQLHVQAPQGAFFYSLGLVRKIDGEEYRLSAPESREATLGGEHFRLSGQGSRSAHFHTRQLGRADAIAEFEFRLTEAPPGTLGRCVLTSAMTTGFIAVASVVSGLSLTPASSAAVLSLLAAAVPLALTGAAFVTQSRASERRVISLLGFFCAWWVFILGLAGAVLLGLRGFQARGASRTAAPAFLDDVWWEALFNASLASCVAITFVYLLRRARFHQLVKAGERRAADLEGLTPRD